jgi:MerR family transcriptional regulator, heat shock protein HspR
MTGKLKNKYDVRIDPEAPLFVIGVVSEMVQMPIWTLRKLDEMGVVQPERKGKKIRCYSQKQIQKLSYVHYLMEEKRVNISGVKIILEMEQSG